jgi:hypothetical protein
VLIPPTSKGWRLNKSSYFCQDCSFKTALIPRRVRRPFQISAFPQHQAVIMASQNRKTTPGAHYSGNNPIPNVQKFIASLDKDKKERDAKIDQQTKAKQQGGTAGTDVKEHTQGQPSGVEGTRKTVTDPTTGKEVQIEDVNADFMEAVKNPMVCCATPHFCSIG